MILINNEKVDLNIFYDGTFHIKLNNNIADEVNIEWLYNNDSEFLAIQMIVKHYAETLKVNLSIPYFPNARMDRVEDEQTLFTLKYFIELINELPLNSVSVLDPHSDYIEENLNKVIVKKSSDVVKELIDEDTLIVFPDLGAYKRYHEDYIQNTCISINKTRDWKTGKLLSAELENLPEGFNAQDFKRAIIVDDICSRGGTFMHASTLIKDELGIENIDLYVSHLEDNVVTGDLLTGDYIKTLYTTNSIERNGIIENYKVPVIVRKL